MRKVLVTGMSGIGKSTALAALSSPGFRIVDTDSPILERVGAGRVALAGGPDRRAPRDRPRATALRLRLHVEPGEVLRPVRGGRVAQRPRRRDLERVEGRTTNDYGKASVERELILRHLASVEPRLQASCTHEIDASRPLEEVVDALAAIALPQRQ